MRSLIIELYNALLVPRHRYADSNDQMRARVTLLFSLLFILINVLTLLGLVVLSARSDTQFNNASLAGALVSLVFQVVLIGLVHYGYLRPATVILFLFLLGSAAATLIQGINSSFVLALALPILYASLLWFWRGTVISALLSTIILASAALLQLRGQLPQAAPLAPERAPIQVVVTLLILFTVSAMCGAFAYELQRALRHITWLLIRLRATAEMATQAVASIGDLNELYRRTVHYIRDRFAFYHVQLFLVDKDRQYASLVASTSEAGETLLQRGYRLSIGSQSTIGQVMLLGEPVIANITEADDLPQHIKELSHDMRSELALPLIVGDLIIGVLDVQSARPHAFSQEDIDSLATVATQISVAIHNAQLFEEQRAALNENRRLFLEAELHLREAQRLNQRLTGEAWEEYLRSRNIEAIGYTLADNYLREDTAWTPTLAQAASKRRPVVVTDSGRQIVAAPVELRGRIIGAIEVEMSGSVRQSDALEMLQSVAQRLALSIDNARLFEQAQELAQQELEVNAISAKIQSVTNMDEIVETAIGELSRALGASQASIRLGTIAPTSRNGGNGSDGKGTAL